MRDSRHTIRGTFPWHVGLNADPQAPTRLLLDNGDFRSNFIVESFEVFPTACQAFSHEAFPSEGTIAVLATRENAATAAEGAPWQIVGARVNDNRQIGWSLFDSTMRVDHIDPDHIIVEDLWVNCWITDPNTGVEYLPNQPVGFIIKLRNVKTTIYEAILALIKARAQDDTPGA